MFFDSIAIDFLPLSILSLINLICICALLVKHTLQIDSISIILSAKVNKAAEPLNKFPLQSVFNP